MTIFTTTRDFEEELAPISRRRLRRKLQAPRAAAAVSSFWSGHDDSGLDLRSKGILGAVAGAATILLVKVSMVWAALQAV